MTRIRKGKIEKRKVFLFVEGETEEKYFEFLKQKLRLSNVKIKTVVLDNSGKNWLEKAKRIMVNNRQFRPDKNTDVFVIFDKDDVTENDYVLMLEKAQEENIYIGFTNLMFEVWLLAHFEKMTNGVLSKPVLMNKVSKHLGRKYTKANSDQLEKMVDLYQEAIANSEDIKQVDYYQQSTNIGVVIEKIRR